MLSILIPIHNYKIVPLVKAVFQQCRRLKIEYEILCFDDFSQAKYKEQNKIIGSMFKINYMELSENIGRSKIRNWLAKSARYDHLLYLDCDSKIIDSSFIKKYVAATKEPYDIIHGGRVYQAKKPRAKSKYLHWLYGTKRESASVRKRNRHPERYFHTNNFMVRKQLIRDYPFDESLSGYGYEDLVMAQQLLDKGYTIRSIDNAVRHLGIENNQVFLNKTKNAIENLVDFEQKNLIKNTRIQKTYGYLKKYKIDKKAHRWLANNIGQYENNLLSQSPALWKLDAYKLYHYLSLQS